jgi:uncharacterized protein (DUF1501 family)
MNITRRNFVKGGIGLAATLLSPLEILALAQKAQASGGMGKALVVVQLAGGNDGLNTVVPYGMGAYYQARPQLSIADSEVIPLNNQIGLHPNMSGMADLYQYGNLALLQAVGYPQANRSHYRSMEIWQTAYPDQIARTGWLGRYLDSIAGDKSQPLLPAVNVDPILPKTLSAANVVVPSMKSINASFDLSKPYVELLRNVGLNSESASLSASERAKFYKGTQTYPDTSFAQGLKFIAQMIVGGIGARIYNISLAGFDTHANQARTHANLLKQLSEGLAAFQADLQLHAVDQNVLTVTFSEFGRRLSENGAQGTDHGTAAPMFIVGSAVNGGIYGNHASLTKLDNGDLRHQIDFRTVYATILDRFLGADSRQILGTNYDYINFV